jgi:hypothetical protein
LQEPVEWRHGLAGKGVGAQSIDRKADKDYESGKGVMSLKKCECFAFVE